MFGVAPSRVELLRGRTSRNKSFRISGATLLPPITLAGDDAKGSDES
jgi:uncharacterized protein YggU (UPF0235/DUF167 family)